MNPLFFDRLGAFFAFLFILTIFWEIISRFSKGNHSSTQTLIITPKETDWDPFKHLGETAHTTASNSSLTDSPLTTSPTPEQELQSLKSSPSISSSSEADQPALVQPLPQTLETSDPIQTPVQPNTAEIEDPWKSLMQKQSKDPLKQKVIPLEIDLKSENKEEK